MQSSSGRRDIKPSFISEMTVLQIQIYVFAKTRLSISTVMKKTMKSDREHLVACLFARSLVLPLLARSPVTQLLARSFVISSFLDAFSNNDSFACFALIAHCPLARFLLACSLTESFATSSGASRCLQTISQFVANRSAFSMRSSEKKKRKD